MALSLLGHFCGFLVDLLFSEVQPDLSLGGCFPCLNDLEPPFEFKLPVAKLLSNLSAVASSSFPAKFLTRVFSKVPAHLLQNPPAFPVAPRGVWKPAQSLLLPQSPQVAAGFGHFQMRIRHQALNPSKYKGPPP